MNLLLDIKSSKDLYPYALTIRFQLESLYNQKLDSQKQSNDLLDEEYINYFRNYKLVEVEDDQVIYLRGKFLRYKIEFIFDSKKKMIFPKLEEGSYRPHFVIKGTKPYLGIEFESSDIEVFDQWGTGVVRTLYDLSLYDDLLPGTEFTIREGKKIVGSGKIIEMIH